MAYVCRGTALVYKQEYDKSFADIEEALKLDPKLVRGYVGRGIVWAHRGDDVKAIADYNEALRLEPNNVTALQNRASPGRTRRS